MDFKVATVALLKNLKTGTRVTVQFAERKPGEWVITSIEPARPAGAAKVGKAAPAAEPDPHASHH